MQKLIKCVEKRPPLWNHRLPLSDRIGSIKKDLWNEVYVELNSKFFF